MKELWKTRSGDQAHIANRPRRTVRSRFDFETSSTAVSDEDPLIEESRFSALDVEIAACLTSSAIVDRSKPSLRI
jgi:hypothetical protein